METILDDFDFKLSLNHSKKTRFVENLICKIRKQSILGTYFGVENEVEVYMKEHYKIYRWQETTEEKLISTIEHEMLHLACRYINQDYRNENMIKYMQEKI